MTIRTEDEEEKIKIALQHVSIYGKFLVKTKTVTAWINGRGVESHWNWWNPITWVLIPILMPIVYIAACYSEGIKYAHKRVDLRKAFSPSAYWKDKKRIFIRSSDI